MDKYIILKGQKIDLCATNPQFLNSIAPWVNDMESAIFIGRTPPYNIVAEEMWLKRYDPPSQDKIFTIFEKDGDVPIGVTSLDSVNYIDRTAYLGAILSPNKRNNSFGKEALILTMDFGFNAMNLHTIIGNMYEFNSRILNISNFLGGREVGYIREGRCVGGKYYPIHICETIDAEFREKNISTIDKIIKHIADSNEQHK